MRLSIIPLIFIFIIITGCGKDEKFINDSNETFYTSSIFGTVLDENNQPVKDASIIFSDYTTKTDKNGVYRFHSAEVSSKHNLVRIKKEGYFDGSRVFTSGRKANILLKNILSKKEFNNTFNAINGATIKTDQVELIFPSNAIKIESTGQNYSGKVKIAIKYLNPISESLPNEMPGDLVGMNEQDAIVKLTSYGMVAIEIESEDGQKLQVAEDKKVMLTAIVPNELLSSAPNSIPLWYYDENKGYWIEEGVATLNGNKYSGEISHFSYWNYDSQEPSIILSGRIIDQDGNPVAGATIRAFKSGTSGAHGITNPDGTFSGFVTKDAILELTILSPNNGIECTSSQLLHNSTIGPFSSDAMLPDISVNLIDLNNFELKAHVINCNNQPVQDGYISIQTGNYDKIYFPIIDGAVNNYLLTCKDQINVTYQVFDDIDHMENNPVSVIINDDIDLGTIAACGNQSDFLQIVNTELLINETIKGEDFGIASEGGGLIGFQFDQPKGKLVSGLLSWDEPEIFIFTPGNYTLNDANLIITQAYYNFISGDITILQGGGEGDVITGNFNIKLEDQLTGVETVFTGSFRKKY